MDKGQDVRYIWPRKIVAVIQIVGGVIGLFANAMAFSTTAQINLMVFLPLAITSGFFAIFIIAGIWLWSNRRSGITLSIVAQLLQFISFSTPAMLYKFVGGLGLTVIISFSTGDVNFAVELGSKWASDFFNPRLPQELGFNILAAFFLFILLRSRPATAIQH